MRRYSTDNTWNGITNILCRRDDQGTCQQKYGGEDIVQTENGVVDLNLLKLEIFFQTS